jgi:Tol biopolymer transport system component
VSYDGKRLVFAMRRNDAADDYHLYVMEVATAR